MSISSAPAVAGVFNMTIKVYTSASGEFKTKVHEGVSLIVETDQGSILLQDVNTVPIAIYAQGHWFGIEIDHYNSVPPDNRPQFKKQSIFATNEEATR
jgi:hypothetical protein